MNWPTRYRFKCNMSWGGDEPTAELDDIVVEYSVRPAENGTDEPGAEVCDITIVSIEGVPWESYLCEHELARRFLAESIKDRLIWDYEHRMIVNAMLAASVKETGQ